MQPAIGRLRNRNNVRPKHVKRWHWYALTFIGRTEDGQQRYSSAYKGVEIQRLTDPALDEVIAGMNFTQGACLISATYVGYMTKEELNT
jgi:hypothetical protein